MSFNIFAIMIFTKPSKYNGIFYKKMVYLTEAGLIRKLPQKFRKDFA